MITKTKYPTLSVYNLKIPWLFFALHIVKGQQKSVACEVLRQKSFGMGEDVIKKRTAVEGLRISYKNINLYVYLTGWLAPKHVKMKMISPMSWHRLPTTLP